MTTQRTVLITGAAGGLGRAFAQGFGSRGYRVAVADLNAAGAMETKQLLADAGVTSRAFEVDVTDQKSAATLAVDVADFAGGAIDVVVNNAAVYATVKRSPLEEIDPDEWDLVMNVNLKGPWLVTKSFSPYLADYGRVINISSATVFSGSAHWAHYVASKGGVIALSRVMAKELGARNITVNCIAPGFTLTEASLNLMEDASSYGVDRGSIKRASQPEDIVGTALFLASEDAGYITGQTLIVDGGRQFI